MVDKKASVIQQAKKNKSILNIPQPPIPPPPKSQQCPIAMAQIVKPPVFQECENRRYDRIKLMIPARHDKRFGMGIINSKGKVIISTVAPNSIAFDYFEPKDLIISINGVQISDKVHCKKLILSACSSAPEFEIVIERLKKEVGGEKIAQSTGTPKTAKLTAELDKSKSPGGAEVKQTADAVIEIPDLSFARPLKEQAYERGNPVEGFRTAPTDVRKILQFRTKTIVADFMPPYRRVAKAKTDKAAQFNLSDDAHLSRIASDVPIDKQLMKPRK